MLQRYLHNSFQMKNHTYVYYVNKKMFCCLFFHAFQQRSSTSDDGLLNISSSIAFYVSPKYATILISPPVLRIQCRAVCCIQTHPIHQIPPIKLQFLRVEISLPQGKEMGYLNLSRQPSVHRQLSKNDPDSDANDGGSRLRRGGLLRHIHSQYSKQSTQTSRSM